MISWVRDAIRSQRSERCSRAEMRYFEETVKPCEPRGYHQPSMTAWVKAQERVMELKREIAEREAEQNE